MNQPKLTVAYIPSAREKARTAITDVKVYQTIGEIRRLEAEQEALINKLLELI